MDLGLENILIILLSALTVVYFFVGLIVSYFFGSSKAKKFGLSSLVIFVLIIISFILRGSGTATENIASAVALGFLFLAVPIATFTIGVLSSNIAKKYIKKPEIEEPKI